MRASSSRRFVFQSSATGFSGREGRGGTPSHNRAAGRKMDSAPGPPTMVSRTGYKLMNGKRKTATVAVGEGAAQAVLRRGAAHDIATDEGRVVRMRLGAAPARTLELERLRPPFKDVRSLSDADIEILACEIEAWLHLKARTAAGARAKPAPQTSRTKEKIVRALRKKA